MAVKPPLLPTCHSGYSSREENLLMHLDPPDVRVTKLENPPVGLFIRLDRYINGVYYWKYSFYTIRCIRGGWRAAVKQELSVLCFSYSVWRIQTRSITGGIRDFVTTFCDLLTQSQPLSTPTHQKTAVSAVQAGLHYQNYKSAFLLK